MRLAGNRKNSAPAFTLIEVVVSLTILAVVAAIAIPTLKGLDAGEKARGPMRDLADLVQETRQRAMVQPLIGADGAATFEMKGAMR